MFGLTKEKIANSHTFPRLMMYLGLGLTTFCTLLLVYVLYPVIIQEFKFFVWGFSKEKPVEILNTYPNEQNKKVQQIVPVDTEFSIIVPKIRANAKIIKNVNPFDFLIYQNALAKGVAHAQGSELPGQPGNVFLFAHSSQNFYEAGRYNSVFYLLNKLEKGDEYYIYYENKPYRYTVSDVRIVNADEVSYLTSDGETAQRSTLMTCWPAGTTLKRLIVVGELSVK